MSNTINYYVIAEKSTYFFVAAQISKHNHFRSNGFTDNFIQARIHLEKNKQDLVIVYKNIGKNEDFKSLFEFFDDNNIRSIAVCKNVREGFEMLHLGATDMVTMPETYNDITIYSFINSLVIKLRALSKLDKKNARHLKNTHQSDKEVDKIVMIGASMGGTEAIQKILCSMPPQSPPILITQHMPPIFTKMYAEKLHKTCGISVWEGKDGDKLQPGLAIIAPGDKHMEVVKKNNSYYITCYDGVKVDGHCPSVNVLFQSAAKSVGENAIGVILTGMGSDGARGLLEMKSAGAYTIGQNKESSVVYGMPKVAYDIGAVSRQEHIDNIARLILSKVY